MTVFSTICDAISNLEVLEISYGGTIRIVEPHLIGRNTKGNVCLSAFQLSGGSGVSFRAFKLDEIVSASPIGENFEGPRPGYNPQDQTMVEIYARI